MTSANTLTAVHALDAAHFTGKHAAAFGLSNQPVLVTQESPAITEPARHKSQLPGRQVRLHKGKLLPDKCSSIVLGDFPFDYLHKGIAGPGAASLQVFQ